MLPMVLSFELRSDMSPNSTSDSDAGEMAGVSILLVEDESITREFLSQIIPMKVPSVNIHTAENGQVGLELFRKTQDRFGAD